MALYQMYAHINVADYRSIKMKLHYPHSKGHHTQDTAYGPSYVQMCTKLP